MYDTVSSYSNYPAISLCRESLGKVQSVNPFFHGILENTYNTGVSLLFTGMLYHADADLTSVLVKASMKKKDFVNEDMLKYAIFISQIHVVPLRTIYIVCPLK